MYDICKNCNKRVLEHIGSMFEEPYLEYLCDECCNLLNEKILKLENEFYLKKLKAINKFIKDKNIISLISGQIIPKDSRHI